MNLERRHFHSLRLLMFAGENGTAEQIDDMSYAISILSKLEGELFDIKSGARDKTRHKHHDPRDLRYAIRDNWRMIRKLEKEISNNR
jgi:hypothetical protein